MISPGKRATMTYTTRQSVHKTRIDDCEKIFLFE